MHLHLTNVGKYSQGIYPGDKIIQFLLIPIFYDTVEEVDLEDLYEEVTDRADGGFGSTSKE